MGQGSYTYTGNNRMVGYSYDASGNLLSNNLSSNYTYDAEGRLAAVGSVAYVYDAAGRRVAKLSGTTPTNIYLLGLNGEQVSELDGNGNWLRSNAYAGGKLLATYTPAGLHFHFTDWLGSRRVQGNVTGTVEETCQSLPFGDSLNCSGSDSTELHFTGKLRDAESGLDYFGARYYASSLGRFMSPDWSAKAQAVPYAKLVDPQTLNLYGYVGNNPLSKADADGHCWPICGLITSVSTYVATHPALSNALAAVGSTMGIKLSAGIGGGGTVPGTNITAQGSVTGYASISAEQGQSGVGAQLNGKAGAGPVGGSVNVNLPVSNGDGDLVNPIKNASGSVSGTLTGVDGKTEVEGNANGKEASIGGTYGEGFVVGVEVNTGVDSVINAMSAFGDALASDARDIYDGAKESLTFSGSSFATPTSTNQTNQ